MATGDIPFLQQTATSNNYDELTLPTSAGTFKTALSLNNVENTALSTWPGTTNLTTLGTIATGTWQGSAIGSSYGGVPTGGSSGQVLTKNSGTNYDASWAAPSTGAAFNGSVRGLAITTASNTTLTANVQEAVLYNGTTSYRFVNPSTATVNIANVGVINGLDTGSQAASTWYYIWQATNGSTLGYMLSASSTSPTMPSGYNAYWLCGAVYSDGSSHFVPFTQFGNKVSTALQNVFTNETGVTSYTSQSISSFVPTTATTVNGIFGLSQDAGNGPASVASDSSGTGQQLGGMYDTGHVVDSFYGTGVNFINLFLTTAQTIYWKTFDTQSIYRLSINGWSYNW